MSLRTQFSPGKKSTAMKMIQYNAQINQFTYSTNNEYRKNTTQEQVVCNCVKGGDYEKYESNTLFSNTSYKLRFAHQIKTSLGGSTQYGSYYLGQPVVINYLGRVAGQPGGGGQPPKNKF